MSVQGRSYVQQKVAEHLGASSQRPRHPFTALMAGVNPAVCLCTGPTSAVQLTSLHEGARLSPTTAHDMLDLHKTSITLSMYCSWRISVVRDHRNLYLRHDRDDDNQARENDEPQLWVLDCLQQAITKNLHELPTGAPTTRKNNCNCGVFMVFRAGRPWESTSATDREIDDLRITATAGPPQFFAL